MTDFNKGAITMRDQLICRIIGMQNDIGDTSSESYKTLQDLLIMIEKDYGAMFEPLANVINSESEELPKKTIRGFVGEYPDTWMFDTETTSYSANVPKAIDEILNIESKDNDEFRITIEQLHKFPYSK